MIVLKIFAAIFTVRIDIMLFCLGLVIIIFPCGQLLWDMVGKAPPCKIMRAEYIFGGIAMYDVFNGTVENNNGEKYEVSVSERQILEPV